MGILSYLLSCTYIVAFFAAWILAMILYPTICVSFICLLAQPQACLRKLSLVYNTILYLLFCKDKQWKESSEDPASFFPDDAVGVQSKTIVFIRHGESTWNDTFNRGDRSKLSFILYFVPNLLYALAMEWYMFVSGKYNESWFYDSPLSYKGVGQAIKLRKYLEVTSQQGGTKFDMEMMHLLLGDTTPNGEEPKSQLVSSNLRRSITTMALGLQDRLDQQLLNDKILILSDMQEISHNPDALCITPAGRTVLPSFVDRDIMYATPATASTLGIPNLKRADLNRIYSQQIDTVKFHHGNKPIDSTGGKRIESFCSIIFDKISKDCVICGGHSLWFRSFFRAYLPRNVDHVSKKKKLINGGCASFTLLRIEGSDGRFHHMIDSKSIRIIYGGF